MATVNFKCMNINALRREEVSVSFLPLFSLFVYVWVAVISLWCILGELGKAYVHIFCTLLPELFLLSFSLLVVFYCCQSHFFFSCYFFTTVSHCQYFPIVVILLLFAWFFFSYFVFLLLLVSCFVVNFIFCNPFN